MSFLSDLFGGGGRDEAAVQADINRSLRESGGQWTSNLNDLVAERDRARSGGATSGGGIRSAVSDFGSALAAAPGNIARDVRMGTAAGLFSNRDTQRENLAARGYSQSDINDYFARTDATIARSEADRLAQSNEDRGDAQERARMAGQQDMQPEDRMPRYRNPFGTMPGTPGQTPGAPNALTVLPQPPQVTPDMRREALRIFESQRGAGQIPYQMLPYQQGLGSMRRPGFLPITPRMRQPVPMPIEPPGMPMPQPRMPQQNVSPAFQYAAQNYPRLGGAQRLMDRPMEMMSVAERQRINDMAQGMAGMQRPTMAPGKGAGAQPPQSDVLRRIMPVIGQMGIGSLRGSATPMPPQ